MRYVGISCRNCGACKPFARIFEIKNESCIIGPAELAKLIVALLVSVYPLQIEHSSPKSAGLLVREYLLKLFEASKSKKWLIFFLRFSSQNSEEM